MNPGRQTILFQGDSITDGNRDRNEDPNHILGHGYAFTIASKLGFELASYRPHFINRGVSGNRVADLYARWDEDAINLNPDLISIMIGVNDVWRNITGQSGDRFERAYRHLLAETKDRLPSAGLVLCEPFILKVGITEEKWDEWRKRIDDYRRIVHQLAEDYDAVFVPLQDAFDKVSSGMDAAYWIWDGVHPTAVGHKLIALEWLSIVQNSPLAIR